MLKFFVIAIATVSFSSVAYAGDSGQPKQADTKAEKKICRFDRESGSEFPKRECHTRDEWHAIDAENDRNATRSFDQGSARGRE